MLDSFKRDSEAFAVRTNNPNSFYKKVRAAKSIDISVRKLFVRDRVYFGDAVCHGFYDSISYLKTEAHKNLEQDQVFNYANDEYRNILRICNYRKSIPQISLEKTSKILKSIRPAVSDISSITGFHYLYSGEGGLLHLNLLVCPNLYPYISDT